MVVQLVGLRVEKMVAQKVGMWAAQKVDWTVLMSAETWVSLMVVRKDLKMAFVMEYCWVEKSGILLENLLELQMALMKDAKKETLKVASKV